jgi:NADPH:quinone reductase-like Zn-dependent oxidoreductase
MKAALITCEGTPVANNVKFVDDWEDITAAAGCVVVKTEASALNHLDLWVGEGMPGLGLTYPRISGSDGCGIVNEVGDDVNPSWIGKRVLLNAAVTGNNKRDHANQEITMIGEHSDGTNAEYFSSPITNVMDIGDVDPVDAAAFGLTHLTAWRMLTTCANLKEKQTVLITGIGGGVALAALNICNHFGCRTIVTSRHQQKLDRANELGASDCVLDEGSDWSRTIRSLTEKEGVHVCIDSVGGQLHHPIIKSLARGGTLVTCGCTAGGNPTTDLTRIFWNQLSVMGSTMGTMDEFTEVTQLLRDGLKPVIDSVHDAKDAQQAFARLESSEQFGKVVLRWV